MFITLSDCIGSFTKIKINRRDVSGISNKPRGKFTNFSLASPVIISEEESERIKRTRNANNEFKINFSFYTTPDKLPTFRRILINSEFFRITMLNNKNVLDGIATILKRVNRALSYYWNLEIYYNDKTNTYYIADANKTQNNSDGVYEFKIQGSSPDSHMVKSISFSTKTSTLAAVNTFFAATKDPKENGIIGLPNEIIFDGLYKKNPSVIFKDMFFTDIKKDAKIVVDIEKLCEDSALNLYTSHIQQFFANKLLIFLPIPHTYMLDGDSTRKVINKWKISTDELALKNIQLSEVSNEKPKNTDPTAVTKQTEKSISLYGDSGLRIILNKKLYGSDTDIISMIVPLEMELEILGISGINIGDCFRIDYMPDVFKKTGVFFVSGISHSISNNMWITKLKSSYRILPNMKDTR